MENKTFVASAFKTFDLKLDTLAERIAFQKTIYLMQQLGSGTNFNFIWHNFGPYSSELAIIGQLMSNTEKQEAEILTCKASIDFKELKKDEEKNSKFLEMMADIVFLTQNAGIHGEEAIFNELCRHRSYLNDQNLFKLSIQRLETFNLI